jgi:hypothetical protein
MIVFLYMIVFVKPEEPEPDSWGMDGGDAGLEEDHAADADMLNVSSFGKYIYMFFTYLVVYYLLI